MKLKVVSILYCSLLMIISEASHAKTITVKLAAHVRDAGDPDNLLGNQIYTGQQVTAEYSYDSAVLDSNSDPMFGAYSQTAEQAHVSVTAGSLKFESDPSPSYLFAEMDVHPSNWPGFYQSFFRLQYYHLKPMNNGTRVDNIFIQFDDYTGHTPSSEALQTDAPDLTRYANKTINISGGTNTSSFGIILDIDSATVEPTSSDASQSNQSVSPTDGSFLRFQRFDAAILLPTGTNVVNIEVSNNGVSGLFSFGSNCFLAPLNSRNQPAIFCPNAAYQLHDGLNHVVWHIFLANGQIIEKSVDWEIIP